MSDNTEITPELLRFVAAWLRDNAVGALPGKPMAAEFLDGAADDLEREQADEKRIDEYARIFYEAEIECFGASNYPEYSDRRPEYQEGTRAGVRAVLDKLRIDSYTSPCDGKCGDDSPHNVHLTPEGRRHFLGEPREWVALTDIPDDVTVVQDVNGTEWRRTPDGHWAIDPTVRSLGVVLAPFTEVIDGE